MITRFEATTPQHLAQSSTGATGVCRPSLWITYTLQSTNTLHYRLYTHIIFGAGSLLSV